MNTSASKLLFLAFTLCALALSALAAFGQNYIVKSHTNATAAVIYMEPQPTVTRLVSLDAISDKVAAQLVWRVGTTQMVLLKAGAALGSNFVCTPIGGMTGPGMITTNSKLISLSAGGVMNYMSFITNTLTTNTTVYLERPLGTNIAAEDMVRGLTGIRIPILASTASNSLVVASNVYTTFASNFVAVGTPLGDFKAQYVGVASLTTNLPNYTLTLSNLCDFIPQALLVVSGIIRTNHHVELATDVEIDLNTTNGLAKGGQIVVLPTTGGAFIHQIAGFAANRYASVGVQPGAHSTLALGDQLFILGASTAKPVYTNMFMGYDPIRILPAGVPGVLDLDGTATAILNTIWRN